MKEIYLDNAATTKTDPRVNELIFEVLEHDYANPSSLHKAGMIAEKRIKTASQTVAKMLGCAADEIYFTSGGTEANNLAILGFAQANIKRGRHLITTKIEHPSVAEPIKYLAENGFEVDYLDVDLNGNLSLTELEDKLRPDTILVSIMHINNEVGSILPVDRIKMLIKLKSPNAALHVDAVQSFGKIDVLPVKWDADMVSISAHKIHGPKGVGALYVKKDTIIKPIIYGGGHQRGLRSGTENVAGIAGFGEAARLCYENMKQSYKNATELKQMLWHGIESQISDVVRNGDENGSPYILNVSFLGIRSEILLHCMERRGIYVSSGSACSSNKPQSSGTLTAMGKTAKQIDSAIRFSMSRFTTKQEIEECVHALTQEVATVRRYIGR